MSIEDPAGGALDDVVVRRQSGASEYWQAKSSNSGNTVIDEAWLLIPITSSGRSPLQHFHDTWKRLSAGGSDVDLTLAINRGFAPSSKVLALRDGRSERIHAKALFGKGPRSEVGRERRRWAEHLDVSIEELAGFLSQVRLYNVSEPILRELAASDMARVGLRADDEAVELGTSMVANWVMNGSGPQTPTDIGRQVVEANLLATPGVLVLAVHAIDHVSTPTEPNVELDIVDWYAGTDPRERYRLSEHGWNEDVLPLLLDRVRQLERFSLRRVNVTGSMRLPMWFAAGFHLPSTRGWVVSARQLDEEWSSANPDVTAQATELGRVAVGAGTDLAVALSLSNDIRDSVGKFVTESGLPVGTVLHLSAPGGHPGSTSIAGGPQAAGWARSARDAVLGAVRSTGATRVHLFSRPQPQQCFSSDMTGTWFRLQRCTSGSPPRGPTTRHWRCRTE